MNPPRQEPIEMADTSRPFFDQVMAKHPGCSSPCGALLAEMSSGEKVDDRSHAALLYGLRACRRGVRKIESLIRRTDPSAERYLLGNLLFALARMDTEEAHAVLVRLLTESNDPTVRADVLEAMTFEEELFDLSIVLPFTSPEAEVPEILSALYALRFRTDLMKPREVRRRVEPLLRHENRDVRTYTIEMLHFERRYRALVLSLADDPDEQVRRAVREGIELLDSI